MLPCDALGRSNNPYIESIVGPSFSKNQRSSLCGFDFERNPEKDWGNEKTIHEQKAEFVYLCVREKKNSFKISVIILRL